jgi:hypothetical protein
MRISLAFLLGLFSLNTVFSQENTELGFLPKIVLSNKINDNSKWVNSIESRTFVEENLATTHSLVDISSIYSRKISENQSINFGYILRFEGSEQIHRTFQYFNVLSNFSALKIAHRFAFEQFYQREKQTNYRTRYRISLQKALNGERIDINEFYLKIGNEYLYDFSDLEVRLTPYLGYQLSKKDKLETGFDYRLGDLFANSQSKNLWFRITWYILL